MVSAAGALDASVVVCTHNRGTQIETTLQSLLAQNFPAAAFEILVVDNASSDGTPALLRRMSAVHEGRIRVVREPVLGLSRARNRGIRESRGAVIAFTDDDAQVAPGWLGVLVEACRRPGVACAGGPVRAAVATPLPAWLTPHFAQYLSVFDKGSGEVALSYHEYPRGVNMAFPRRSFREVGLFSPAFGRTGQSLLSNEDLDLCYRLERRGGRILYMPDAVVYHTIDPARITLGWFRRRFYWQGKADAYFDLVHRGAGCVTARLIRFARAALAQRLRPSRAGRRSCLDRAYLTWTAMGYGVGAIHGWSTRIAHRGRPAPYDDGPEQDA